MPLHTTQTKWILKKKLKILALIISVLTLTIGQTAFAAEPALTSIETVESADEIQPRGTLSGYGTHWYNVGEDQNGNFTFNVTGVPWVNAHLTISIDNFDADIVVRASILKPDGSFAYTTYENPITMANRDNYAGISFSPGEVGTYTVVYQILSISLTNGPSSGRINVWVY